MRGVTGEDEVGTGWQNLEAEALQFHLQRVTLHDDHLLHGIKVRLVFDGSLCARERDTAQRIGIEAVLDALQRLDQDRLANRKTDGDAGKGDALGRAGIAGVIEPGGRAQGHGVAAHHTGQGIVASDERGRAGHQAVPVGGLRRG